MRLSCGHLTRLFNIGQSHPESLASVTPRALWKIQPVCTHVQKKTRWHCDLLKVFHHSIFVNKTTRGITGEGWWLLRSVGSAETPYSEHALHAMSGFNHFHPHQLYQSSLACWLPLHYSAMLFSMSGMAEKDGLVPLNRDSDILPYEVTT